MRQLRSRLLHRWFRPWAGLLLLVATSTTTLGALLGASTTRLGASTTVGIVPPDVPGRNITGTVPLDQINTLSNGTETCFAMPEQDLPVSEVTPCVDTELANVDQARSYEGVGPMVLPSNWTSLTAQEQQFVVINLERTARGLEPFTGHSTLFDSWVLQTAVFSGRGQDPSVPTGVQLGPLFGPGATWPDFGGGGSGLDGGNADPIAAIFAYLYDDGCGVGPDGGSTGFNTVCLYVLDPQWTVFPSWGHRLSVLTNSADNEQFCAEGGCWVGIGIDNGGKGPGSAWLMLEVASGSQPGAPPATPTPTFLASVDLTWANELPFVPACEQTIGDDTCTVPTTVSVSSSNTNPGPGTSVTLTATVSANGGGIPEGGSISMFNGSAPIASCQGLSVPNPGYDGYPQSTTPQVTCTTSFTSPGPQSITASYSGGSLGTTAPTSPLPQGVQGDMGIVPAYAPSTSPAVVVTVPAGGAPGIVTAISASIGNGSATVSWVPPVSWGSSAISSYTITASPGGLVETAPGSASSLDFTGLSNATSYTFTVVAVNQAGPGPMSAESNSVTPSATYFPQGYWLLSSTGATYGFGSAPHIIPDQSTVLPDVSAIASTPDGGGYYISTSNANYTFTAGDASDMGQLSGGDVGPPFYRPTAPVVAIASGPGGAGYWVASSSGEVASSGDATFYGSPVSSGLHLAAPIVAMAATPDRKGYWLLGQDGGVFSYGDAAFYGSTGAMHLNAPVVSLTPTLDARGYWLVASDGGVFSFGDATFYGSTGAMHLSAPIVAIASTSNGHGYWLFGADGGVFSFGDATFYGSAAGIVSGSIIGVAVTYHASS